MAFKVHVHHNIYDASKMYGMNFKLCMQNVQGINLPKRKTHDDDVDKALTGRWWRAEAIKQNF